MLIAFLKRYFATTPHPTPAERRAARRSRTRLRPGKILGPDRTFLADCAIVDRSSNGVRAHVFDVAPLQRQDSFRLLDENDGSVREARLVWSREGTAGFTLGDEDADLSSDERRRITGPYYAVTD